MGHLQHNRMSRKQDMRRQQQFFDNEREQVKRAKTQVQHQHQQQQVVQQQQGASAAVMQQMLWKQQHMQHTMQDQLAKQAEQQQAAAAGTLALGGAMLKASQAMHADVVRRQAAAGSRQRKARIAQLAGTATPLQLQAQRPQVRPNAAPGWQGTCLELACVCIDDRATDGLSL